MRSLGITQVMSIFASAPGFTGIGPAIAQTSFELTWFF